VVTKTTKTLNAGVTRGLIHVEDPMGCPYCIGPTESSRSKSFNWSYKTHQQAQ